MSSSSFNSNLLRKSLHFNGYFSAFSGLTCVVFSENVAASLGLSLDFAGEVVSQGITLLIFSGFLLLTSSGLTLSRPKVLLISGVIAITLDVVWVLGSAHVLISDLLPLSTLGQWLVAIVAFLVLDFALFQSLGVRQLLKSQKSQVKAAGVYERI